MAQNNAIKDNVINMAGSITKEPIELKPENVDNSLLKRLISEVNHDMQHNIAAYNRTHNRHNRHR